MALGVTGASGFLGLNSISAICESTDSQVVIFHRDSTNIHIIKKRLNNNQIVFANLDVVNLDQVFSKNKIDSILHMATNYGRYPEKRTGDNNRNQVLGLVDVVSSNLILPLSLLEVGKNFGIKKFINIDSYFNKGSQIYTALFNYSNSKRALNSWLEFHSKDLSVVNLQVEHMYGPGDSSKKFVPQVLNAAKKSDLNFKLSPGQQILDFVYVSDVTSAIIAGLLNFSTIGFHNLEVGTGIGTKLADFVKIAYESTGNQGYPKFGTIPYRQQEIMNSTADLRTWPNNLWQPTIKLTDGIALTLMKDENL